MVDIRIAVVTVLTIFASLFLGLVITDAFSDVADAQDLGASGNATRTNLKTNVNTAFTLFVLLPLILGAGVVMRYLGWLG